MQIWSSLSSSGGRSTKVPSSIFSIQSIVENLCIHLTPHWLHFVDKGSSNREKIPCSCNSQCQISLSSLWRYASHLLLPQHVEHSGSKFPLSLGVSKAAPIFILEPKWFSRHREQISRWWFHQPTRDTARRCRSLLLPAVSVSFLVSIQLLRDS